MFYCKILNSNRPVPVLFSVTSNRANAETESGKIYLDSLLVLDPNLNYKKHYRTGLFSLSIKFSVYKNMNKVMTSPVFLHNLRCQTEFTFMQ